jgi:type 1 fimbriae regulatory protein FimB/type 1 fimbriae regulatory protein FimE
MKPAKRRGRARTTRRPSDTVNGRVAPPRRETNAARRSREHLVEAEVERLIVAAGKLGRHGHRDSTMILIAYRHGLRVGELVALQWSQVDLDQAVLHVRRLKQGTSATHPLTGRELRALRRLRRDYPDGPHLFVSERGGPLTENAVGKLVARAGDTAGLELPVHPHMLRHACGYTLANRGTDTRAIQAYLGHRSITHTVRYTELAADRFNGLWAD